MSLSRRELLRTAAALAAGGAGGSLLSACGGDAQDTLARARDAGVIRLGHANEPPFGYVDGAGRLTGYSVEVVRTIAARLGIPRVEGTATEFGGLLDGLGTGAYDIIAAGMFVTPERCDRALFAPPEFCTREAFIVRRGPLEQARSLRALAATDAGLGVLRGSTEAARAARAGLGPDRLREYPDKATMRAALLAREVDALALTSISLRRLMRELPGERFTLTGPEDPATACGATAFRLRDRRLRDAFARELRASVRDGRLVAIGRRFGLEPAEVPPRAPTAGTAC